MPFINKLQQIRPKQRYNLPWLEKEVLFTSFPNSIVADVVMGCFIYKETNLIFNQAAFSIESVLINVGIVAWVSSRPQSKG